MFKARQRWLWLNDQLWILNTKWASVLAKQVQLENFNCVFLRTIIHTLHTPRQKLKSYGQFHWYSGRPMGCNVSTLISTDSWVQQSRPPTTSSKMMVSKTKSSKKRTKIPENHLVQTKTLLVKRRLGLQQHLAHKTFRTWWHLPSAMPTRRNSRQSTQQS